MRQTHVKIVSGWALAIGIFALAAILFYKWVERPHKIIVGKLAIGILAIGFIGLLMAGFISWTESRRTSEYNKRRYMDKEARDKAAAQVFIRFAKDTALAFGVCNFSGKTLNTVTFTPMTRSAGRSTEHDVLSNHLSIRGNRLVFDYILKNKECKVQVWSDNFSVLDSTYATDVRVEFADEVMPGWSR